MNCEIYKFKWRYRRNSFNDNLSNCNSIWKRYFGASTGFEPMASLVCIYCIAQFTLSSSFCEAKEANEIEY